jgi:hypothetical protein
MKTFYALILAVSTAIVPLHAEEAASPSPAAPPADPFSALDREQVEQAISVLRRDHVRGAQIDDAAVGRATLRGLLESLAPGAALATEPSAPSIPSPFRAEILDGRAGYLRLGSLQTENLAELDIALRDFGAKAVHGLILDLRATPESSDFALAAQVASRFCAPGTALFTLAGPGRAAGGDFLASGENLSRGVLVVLIDEKTAGAAEALAATLRWNARALLVGTRSSGRCVEFAEVPVGAGQNLRLAVAEVLVAGQAIYPRGLRPDIEIAQDPAERESILAAALTKGAAGFVFEQERAQFDEAALVAGTNPELDRVATDPGLIDRPLQRAVDLVTALRVFRPAD